MSNLFHAIPPEYVAQIHLDPGEVDAARVSRSIRLRGNGSDIEATVRAMVTRANSPRRSLEGVPRITAAETQGRKASARRLRRQIAAATDLMPISISYDTLRWVQDFQPNIIYSQLGSVRVSRLVRALATHLSIPVVPHLMDAWPATLYRNGELFGVGRRAVMSSLRSVVRNSPRLMVISPEMAAEYGALLDVDAEVFLNCVPDEEFACTRGRPQGQLLTVRYVGGLHLDRWRSIVSVAEAMQTVAPKSRLCVNAPAKDLKAHARTIPHLPNLRLGPSLRPNEVSAALQDSDVLLHVESFSPDTRAYTRLSISTKLPQYMAAGRAVLGYGPPEGASMRHIRESGCGIVATENLTDSLQALLQDSQAREDYGRRGYQFALKNHRRQVVSGQFLSALKNSAGVQQRRTAPSRSGRMGECSS